MKFFRYLYLIPVYIYRAIISPFTAPSCRYTPSCSAYFLGAVERFGIIKGTIMGIARIARCRNKYLGGPDPVPASWAWKDIKNEYRIRKKPKNFDQSFK